MILGKEEILKLIVEKKMIEDYIDLEQQLQSCGFDVTVDRIYRFKDTGTLAFDNTHRKLPEKEDITDELSSWEDEIQVITLQEGHYLVKLNETVRLPKDVAAIALPRSSLMRMGSTISSALWDPGYEGKGYLLLIVGKNGLKIERNARFAQLVFFSTIGAEEYRGSYYKENLQLTIM